jgi:hypothetical protein
MKVLQHLLYWGIIWKINRILIFGVIIVLL